MKMQILVLATILLLSGCALDGIETVNTSNVTFDVAKHSRVFFENVVRAGYDNCIRS